LRALLVSKEDSESGDVDSFVSPSGLPLQGIQNSNSIFILFFILSLLPIGRASIALPIE
jgi:hypothetical protein